MSGITCADLEAEEGGGLLSLFSLRDWIIFGALLLLVIGVWRRR